MKYIFFSIITITIFSAFFYKKYYIQISIFTLTILFLMLLFPHGSLNAAREGINLWLFIVIPSLFPFFIINDILIALKIPESISKIFSPFAKLFFNTSGYGGYAFIMSIFSGYPSGAKITAQLIEQGKISTEEGQRIMTFSSTSGPLFIVGAVGSGMLKNAAAGYILFTAHILGSILNGILFRFLLGKVKINKSSLNSEGFGHKNFSDILSRAISNSLVTCGYIGGYIILFSVIVELFSKIEFFQILNTLLAKLALSEYSTSVIISMLKASMELSNGCQILSKAGFNINLTLCLISFIISFSGFSIIGQVSSVISKTKINLKLYIISKVSHGVLSSLICYIILELNLLSLKASTNSSILVLNTLPVLLIILLIIVMSLNIIANLKKPKLKR